MSRSRNLLIVRFLHPSGREAGGFHFPAGSVTYGFFWRQRPCVLSAIRRPQGRPIAYRFDAMAAVRLGKGRVDYLDLALDVWVDPAGRTWLEDEAEPTELVSPGLTSPGRRSLIERTGRFLPGRGRIVAALAEATPSRGVGR